MDFEKIPGLTTKQSLFLVEYAKTDNLTQACKVAKISRTTAYRYLENEDFQLALEQMKTKIVNAAWTKMSSNLGKVAQRVLDIAMDPNASHASALRAAALVAEYSARHQNDREILARMEKLEDLLNGE